jgi:hypothetical protein
MKRRRFLTLLFFTYEEEEVLLTYEEEEVLLTYEEEEVLPLAVLYL